MRTLTFTRVLGRGAMGTVYLAELKAPGGFVRSCAVKVIRATGPDREQVITRMRDEARLLGLLQDEQVLGVSELVRCGDHDAVIMDYVEGVDLGELITHRVPPKALCELGGEVAGVLHRAHQAKHPTTGKHLGVVHRDVKPPNVMITARGGVKLLDFGVASARFSDRESVTQGLVLGTLFYLAPEVLADVHGEADEFGSHFGPAVDIYGLGITLWECAAGRSWGKPMIDQRRFEARVNQRLGEMGEGYAALAPLLKRMLAWDPLDRPDGSKVERELLQLSESIAGEGLRTWARGVVPAAMDARSSSNSRDEWVGKSFEVRSMDDNGRTVNTESFLTSKPADREPPPSVPRGTPIPLVPRPAPSSTPSPAPRTAGSRPTVSVEDTGRTASPLKSAPRPPAPIASRPTSPIPRQGPLPSPEPLRVPSNLPLSSEPATQTLQQRVRPARRSQGPSIAMMILVGLAVGALLGLVFLTFLFLTWAVLL